jgi:hypothetical protein
LKEPNKKKTKTKTNPAYHSAEGAFPKRQLVNILLMEFLKSPRSH